MHPPPLLFPSMLCLPCTVGGKLRRLGHWWAMSLDRPSLLLRSLACSSRISWAKDHLFFWCCNFFLNSWLPPTPSFTATPPLH